MQVSVNKILKNENIRQLTSYFFVGGFAAIVEWLMFALLANVLEINYLVATCVAFVFSTAANWILGRLWTFKESRAYEGKVLLEGLLIYAVSGVGLVLNLGLMYVMVTILNMSSPAKKVLSKIIATGIVFFWNFIIRKLVIYRNNA